MEKAYPSDYAVRAYYNSKEIQDSLDVRAEAYINGVGKNVYKLFSFYAWELVMAGQKRVGAKLIAERIRWSNLVRKPDEEEFIVNNSYVSYMARKFMNDNPQCAGLFETRQTMSNKLPVNLSEQAPMQNNQSNPVAKSDDKATS